MSEMLDEGDRCVCQYNDWWNGLGEKHEVLHKGMKLTVAGSKNLAGVRFLTFEEVEEGNYFMAMGFIPLRTLH